MLLAEVLDVWKGFDSTPVLAGVSLQVPRGETMVVMGGSGSGKTVLLRLIAGLLRPDRGQIRLLGQAIERLSEEHSVARVTPDCRLKPGDRVHLLPNHACVVANLTQELLLVDGLEIVGRIPVAARARVW